MTEGTPVQLRFRFALLTWWGSFSRKPLRSWFLRNRIRFLVAGPHLGCQLTHDQTPEKARSKGQKKAHGGCSGGQMRY
jgi:hypothetical protein